MPGSAEVLDLTDLYRRDALQHELLTHREETQLARQVRLGRRAERRLPGANGNRPQLEAIVARGLAARERLILCNQRLVWQIAGRYLSYARDLGLDAGDVIGDGNLGLMRAIESYDPGRGWRFSTFATWWIRQAMSRAIADRGYLIRRPVHMSEGLRRLRRAERALHVELGRMPTSREIAQALHKAPANVDLMLALAQSPISLAQRAYLGDEELSTLGELLAAPDDVAGEVEERLLSEQVARLLDELPVRHALVLRLRYGIGAAGTARGEDLTLEQVGARIGLTRERVRQIQAQAMEMLRGIVGRKTDGEPSA